MTSGSFSSYPIAGISVDRPNRQRKELTKIEELAESIARIGLINPVTITREGNLIAGERRYTAIKSLGWTSIPVQFAEELTEYELQSIEFEENIKRENITWQEECAALERFHRLKAQHETAWTQDSTAEALGLSPRTVRRQLAVASELDNEKVAKADKFSSAVNLVERSLSRRKSAAIEGIGKTLTLAVAEAAPELEEAPKIIAPILLQSFHDWQETYDGQKFNLIHCDFPYGINVASSPRQNSALQDFYADSPDIYWALLERLDLAMSNVVADSANLIFWFSMDYYTQTLAALRSMGWTVNPFPLVWHKSDNSGIAPDPQRWPRRTYETAFVASRGDRKLTEAGPRANSFAAPGVGDDRIHISQKPETMLRHFLSMYCDEYSSLLDPTCGSGSALKAAKALGAASVLGLEQDPDFHQIACGNFYG